MDSNYTFPGLTDAVEMKLQLWRNGDANACPSSVIDPNMQTLIDAHDKKGWDSFYFGVVDSKWIDVQDRFLRSVKRRTIGNS